MIPKVLSAFVKGQAAMLDDRGKLIEQMSGRNSDEPTPQPPPESQDQPDEAADPMNARERTVEVLKAILTIAYILPITAIWAVMLWKFSRFIGGFLFQSSGTLSTLTGFITLLVATIVAYLVAIRWIRARTDTHARQGHRLVSDLLEMLNDIHFYHQCPSCGFSLSDLPQEPDGCTLCPECNGAWNRSWWASFVPAVTLGKLAKKSEGTRSRRCLNDARTAEFEVAAWLPRKERKALLRLAGSCLLWRDRIALLLILLIFLAIWLLLATTANNWTWTTTILFLFVGGLFLVYRFTSGFRQRQQFVRDQIDLGRCAQCDHELIDTPHPIDGALCCPQCRHAWDPDTTNKKHHARKRFKPNDYRHGFPETEDTESAL